METDKKQVEEFWERAACGEDLYLQNQRRDGYAEHARRRYQLEPIIEEFAQFAAAAGQKVLEIGVGLGADHLRFAAAGARLSGIDLTARAVAHTRRRLELFGLNSTLATGDAENLQLPSDAFDLVYSWGVLHHSPDPAAAIAEVHRVLRPGGVAKIMIYHKWSLVGYMLWTRYALLRLRPWLTLRQIYARYLESPGTKAYSLREAERLFAAFSTVHIRVHLTHADLLESAAGQGHGGAVLSMARAIWPRSLLRRFAGSQGLFLLIQAVK
ncbi:MAG TPA: class I SAM-dependent methyltransferase [Steroidobacteraceae bacterium]|jgi:ubiquinone/menaquinone biosynthesis C-methylase UbiE|nr:class I SAM-dependent methyltransferase [Steroidobacteraceae bacterium]